MQQPPQPPYDPQSGPPYQPQSTQYGPPMQPAPQLPRKKSRKKPIIFGCLGLIVLFVVITTIIGLTTGSPSQATTSEITPTTQTQATTAPTSAPTAVPTQAPTSTTAPTATPTTAPTKAPFGIVPTHGQPHLGGNISDFYGKYGQPMNAPSAGSSPSGQPGMSIAWITDQNNDYLLSVQFYTSSHQVFYIDFNGPTWSKAQYQTYLITTFAPPDAQYDTSLNQSWINGGGDPYNPIIYTSSIGNVALHISDGDGNMNTV